MTGGGYVIDGLIAIFLVIIPSVLAYRFLPEVPGTAGVHRMLSRGW